MIQREHYDGPVIFVCDTCGNELDTGDDNFVSAFAMAKAEGWRAMKVNEKWLHACSFACAEELRR